MEVEQTFFHAAGLQRYFTVDYEEQQSPTEEGETPAAASARASDGRFDHIIGKWDHDLDKHQKGLELVDAETAKTDHTLLRHLSRISRLPDREERLLQRVAELNTTLIEKCVAGLSSLDRETPRWLRSTKLPEPVQRPLARLQNASSQHTYATHMARFVCYSLHVLQSCADSERLREAEHSNDVSSDDDVSEDDSNYSDEGSNGDDSSAGDVGHSVGTIVDAYKDARRLYPWHARQRELLRRVQQSIEGDWEDQAQLKALLDWHKSVIFQRIRGNAFTSALPHFLAVLGID
ncbi:hypothetical protein LTR49_018027 [Elasticomyces elasticus]|nr:hypothetical protein LTR49_018027 [Elasticomyces elasticus]